MRTWGQDPVPDSEGFFFFPFRGVIFSVDGSTPALSSVGKVIEGAMCPDPLFEDGI